MRAYIGFAPIVMTRSTNMDRLTGHFRMRPGEQVLQRGGAGCRLCRKTNYTTGRGVHATAEFEQDHRGAVQRTMLESRLHADLCRHHALVVQAPSLSVPAGVDSVSAR